MARESYKLPAIYPAILNTGGHALIAGTTGSGKSVLLNGLIVTGLIAAKYDFYLVDPKKIELIDYKGLACVRGYADTPSAALELLQQVNNIMDGRYTTMQQQGLKQSQERVIIVAIDELADLFISELAPEIKHLVQRLVQLGRAAGIMLIACTQAPNRKILPAEIVLNFTQRIGLRCLTAIESRQVVNIKGCENLPLYGKCVYLRPASEIEIWPIPIMENWITSEVLGDWREFTKTLTGCVA